MSVTETVATQCDNMRGRRIARDIVVRLIGAGAGHCYRPECSTGFLWHELEDGRAIKLAEVAHIVAAGLTGPRSDTSAADEVLAAFDNLILLCPVCHLIVDRAADVYTVEVLQGWKVAHEARVSDLWGIRAYTDRRELSRDVRMLMEESGAIWQTYGPESTAADEYIVDVADAWRREVVARILPNNARIVRLLNANVHLLREDEVRTVARFKMHADALVARHLGGVVNQAAPRYPADMEQLLVD